MTLNKKVVFYVLLIAGIAVLMFVFKVLIGPLVIGALLAYIINPLVNVLRRHLRFSHRLSVSVAFFSLVILLSILVSWLSPTVLRQSNQLRNSIPFITHKIETLQPRLEAMFNADIPLDEIVPELEKDIYQFIQPEKLYRMLLSTSSSIIWILVALVTSYYLLLEHETIKNLMVDLFPVNIKPEINLLIDDINLVWKNYLRGQLIMMFFVGALSGILSSLIGLKGAIVIGITAGVLDIIPSLGPTITTIIAGFMAWVYGSTVLEVSNFQFAVIVCAVFIAIQFLEAIWIQPRVMSKRLNIHPAIIFVAVVATLSTLGMIAGIIIIPLIGSLVLIVKYTYQKSLNTPKTPALHVKKKDFRRSKEHLGSQR